MKPNIWYYKPWTINNNVRYDALFDKNDKQPQQAQVVATPHQLDNIYRKPIKNSMIEVPHE